MVKTLRITTVVATLLAITVFAFPILYGVKTDENIQKFLNSPGVLEKFKAISGNRIQTPINQIQPLVQQSEIFAKIIAPPVQTNPSGSGSTGTGKTIVQPPPPPTVQFTVESTSVCEANPELSQALINEPGKGAYWVRQASTVNHQLIEQVKDGIVIVNNGKERIEIKIDEKKFYPAPPAGTKGAVTRGSTPAPKSTRPTTPVTPVSPPVSAKTPASQTPKTEPKTEPDPERAKKVEELFDKIKLLGAAGSDPNNPKSGMEERAAIMQKLISEFRNSNININEDEAKKLADLGEMLESVKNPPTGN